MNRDKEWDFMEEHRENELNRISDAKTLKAIMFITIKELVIKLPNNQELGAEVRKLVNQFNKDVNSSEYKDLMTN
jgi:hypothetical protein